MGERLAPDRESHARGLAKIYPEGMVSDLLAEIDRLRGLVTEGMAALRESKSTFEAYDMKWDAYAMCERVLKEVGNE